MKAILKKCRSRLKSRRGFSLGEVLITLLILLLVTVIVAEGVPTALRTYDRVVTAANAQALLSTAMTKLRNELSTASGVTANDGNTALSFTADDGVQVKLYLESDANKGAGLHIKETYGVITSDPLSEPKENDRLLVSREASNKNLYVTYESCELKEKGVVAFNNLSVFSDKAKDGGKPLAKINSYEIRVLADSAS